ncbi:MAG: NUDIX domain-containing protein [Acutalibacteraceae bacterium]
MSDERSRRAGNGAGAALPRAAPNDVFTHIRWEMVCYHIRCQCAPPRFVWASPAELRETYALPTAFRIFLEGEI